MAYILISIKSRWWVVPFVRNTSCNWNSRVSMYCHLRHRPIISSRFAIRHCWVNCSGSCSVFKRYIVLTFVSRYLFPPVDHIHFSSRKDRSSGHQMTQLYILIVIGAVVSIHGMQPLNCKQCKSYFNILSATQLTIINALHVFCFSSV